MILCLWTGSAGILHATHRRLVTNAIWDMHTSRACSVWWCHLVLLTIHFRLIGPLRLEYSLLHAIRSSMSLAISGRTHVRLHLSLWDATTHCRLWRVEVSSSLNSSVGVLSVWQTLVVDLLGPTWLCLRAWRMRHITTRTAQSPSIGMRLLIGHLTIALHLCLL